MQFKKDDKVTVTIEDLGSEGEGIGKVDGFPLFIKDALIGDTVLVKIMKAKKNYAYAKLEEILTPSDSRVVPKCQFHKQCGGCQIQAMSYSKQLEYKENKIKNNLIRIGKFTEESIMAKMEPIIGMEETFHYRNKAQFPIGIHKEGKPVTGFYAGRTHAIIPNTNCYLGVKENQVILEKILPFMEQNNISAYDETNHKGLVRHILIRKGFKTGEIMVCLVINGITLPHKEKLIEELLPIKGMTSISLSINQDKTNVIMGKNIQNLWGKEKIRDFIGTIEFEISPLSFFQVNPVQTEKLYELALDYAELTGQETVWDLYCGIGTISLFLAQKAKQVYGVEVIEEAIQDAKENAKRNHIQNAEFYVGKAEEILPQKYREDNIHGDVIVVDPPRKGCDEQCLATILEMQPGKIIYVSCDSATLARDLRYLCDGEYEIARIRGVDQFCHTTCVEIAVLLVRKG